MIGVTGEFSEVWQIQELATFWRKAGVGEGGVRSAARRGRMGLAGQVQTEPCPNRRSHCTTLGLFVKQ